MLSSSDDEEASNALPALPSLENVRDTSTKPYISLQITHQ